MNTAFILIVSFISLLWASNHIITGASGLAARLQYPPFIIGFTVVALGCCIPELIIYLIAFLKNKNNPMMANVIAANLANIALILGVCILVKPMPHHAAGLKKNYPIIIITMLFFYNLILEGILGKVDGCLILITIIALFAFFIYSAIPSLRKEQFFNEFKFALSSNRTLKGDILSIVFGILVLPLSAKYLIQGTSVLARGAGLSELTINLTLVTIGATLPALATAIIAAFKGEEDIAAGTILGANTYSLLFILFFPMIILPTKTSALVLWQDVPVMLSLALLLFFLNYQYKKELSPWHGTILIIVYCSYIISLILKTQVL